MVETLQSALGIIGILVAWAARSHAKSAKIESAEVNDAVNHRHPGTPRIFDLVLENHALAVETKNQTDDLVEWKDGFSGSPWRDAGAINEWIKARGLSEPKPCGSCKHIVIEVERSEDDQS